jgi:chromosomal replication initiation ATPase DnaA
MIATETFQTRNDVLRDTRGWAATFLRTRGIEPADPIERFNQMGPQFIMSHVALTFGIRTEDITSSRRDQVFVRPRQIAMYLATELTRESLPKLAYVFNRRDHTTVMHSRNKIRALIKSSPAEAAAIAALRQLILDSWEEAKRLPISANLDA